MPYRFEWSCGTLRTKKYALCLDQFRVLTLCCSTPTRCVSGGSPTGPVACTLFTDAAAADGLGACSIKAQEGEVLVEAASNEQLAAPGLGRLPPTLLPESSSRPFNEHRRSFRRVLDNQGIRENRTERSAKNCGYPDDYGLFRSERI